MGDIKKTGRTSGPEVLFFNAGKLEGHLIARKGNKLGTQTRMQTMERRQFERGSRIGHAGSTGYGPQRCDHAPAVLVPESFRAPPVRREACSFGETSPTSGHVSFQRLQSPPVLLPERFRGGCAFGPDPAIGISVSRGRKLQSRICDFRVSSNSFSSNRPVSARGRTWGKLLG